MKIGCCWMYAIELYGYPPNIEDAYKALKRIAATGFNYVEFESFGLRDKSNIEELISEKEKLKKVLDDLNLKIVNFPIMLPGLTSLNEKERYKNLELFDRSLEVAVYLDSEMVSLCSFNPSLQFVGESPYEKTVTYGRDFRIKIDPNFSWKKQWEVIVDSFATCNKRCKKVGIKAMIEPRVGEMVSNTDAMLRLIEEIKDDNFGVVLEVPHLHAQKEILPLSVEKLGKRIYYLHAADNDGRDNAHHKLGRGTVDWEGILIALKKHNFQGYAAIDVRPTSLKDIDKEYTESRQFLENLAAKIGL